MSIILSREQKAHHLFQGGIFNSFHLTLKTFLRESAILSGWIADNTNIKVAMVTLSSGTLSARSHDVMSQWNAVHLFGSNRGCSCEHRKKTNIIMTKFHGQDKISNTNLTPRREGKSGTQGELSPLHKGDIRSGKEHFLSCMRHQLLSFKIYYTLLIV